LESSPQSWGAHKRSRDGLGFDDVPGGQVFAHSKQGVVGASKVAFLRTGRPELLVVQGKHVVVEVAVDHGTRATVANGQTVEPSVAGSFEPDGRVCRLRHQLTCLLERMDASQHIYYSLSRQAIGPSGEQTDSPSKNRGTLA
jgi:hypothetical protein